MDLYMSIYLFMAIFSFLLILIADFWYFRVTPRYTIITLVICLAWFISVPTLVLLILIKEYCGDFFTKERKWFWSSNDA